jgi:hypothetical protein
MSLIIRRKKPWERNAVFRFRNIETSLREWHESGAHNAITEIKTNFADPDQDDQTVTFEISGEFEQKGFESRYIEERRDGDSFKRVKTSIREFTETVDGSANTFYWRTFITEEVDFVGRVARTVKREEINGYTSSTDYTASIADDWQTNTYDSVVGTDTFSTTETSFVAKNTVEKLDALDLVSRLQLTQDEEGANTYALSTEIDSAEFTRDVMGLESKTAEAEYPQTVATVESRTYDTGIYQSPQWEYHPVTSSFDMGERFFEIKSETFSEQPVRFRDLWRPMSPGEVIDLPVERIEREQAMIGAGAEQGEVVALFVPSAQVEVSVQNPDGKWGKTRVEFDETRITFSGFAQATYDTVTLISQPITYEIPALEPIGEYASTFIMVHAMAQDIRTTNFVMQEDYQMGSSTETSTSTAEDTAFETSYSFQNSSVTIITSITQTRNYVRTSTFASAFTPMSAIDEEIVGASPSGAEINDFGAYLLQPVLTPGYVPMGGTSEGLLFATYETEEITATFNTEDTAFLFPMPAPVLSGEVVRGRTRLDLSPAFFVTTVTKNSFTYTRDDLAEVYPFTKTEVTEALTRTAQVRQSWRFPESEASVFSVATLVQDVIDSDGFQSAREIEFRLKEPIPKEEQVGYTIETFGQQEGKWIMVNPRSAATVYFGRCVLHGASIIDGRTSTFERMATEMQSFNVAPGTTITMRIERLWQALGKFGSGEKVLTRGSYYLRS